MDNFELTFPQISYTFPFVFVQGNPGQPYRFGLENNQLKVTVNSFFISKYPVTQILWKHIMGDDPAFAKGDNRPVENVSYNEIVQEGGFLQRLQALAPPVTGAYRLPTETEWEYAARGGIYWGNYFVYSGSDNIEEVGWYLRNSNNQTKPVGLKSPNQLGLYDMSGNVWEWCLDWFHHDIRKIPLDGSPCLEQSDARVLRGGCFHNCGMHSTAMKRYEIGPQYKDGCIGFRLAVGL
jgi:formylglycine-generating enzyme required for sulfatase activity